MYRLRNGRFKNESIRFLRASFDYWLVFCEMSGWLIEKEEDPMIYGLYYFLSRSEFKYWFVYRLYRKSSLSCRSTDSTISWRSVGKNFYHDRDILKGFHRFQKVMNNFIRKDPNCTDELSYEWTVNWIVSHLQEVSTIKSRGNQRITGSNEYKSMNKTGSLDYQMYSINHVQYNFDHWSSKMSTCISSFWKSSVFENYHVMESYICLASALTSFTLKPVFS